MVTTPQPLAQDVAARAALMAQKTNMRLLAHREHEPDVFGSGGGAQLAESLGTALLGTVPLSPARVGRRRRAARLGAAGCRCQSRAIVEIAEAVLATQREQGVGIVKELPVIP